MGEPAHGREMSEPGTSIVVTLTSENTWSTATATFFSSHRKLSAKEAGFSGVVLPDAEASCRAQQTPQVTPCASRRPCLTWGCPPEGTKVTAIEVR